MRKSWLVVASVVFGWAFGMGSQAVAAGPQQSSAERVGVTERVFQPSEPRNWRGSAQHALHCIIWYPAADTAVEKPQVIGPPDAPLFLEGDAAPHAPMAPGTDKRPLILLSHGSGGSAAQMAWLGIALAKAGMIAIAVDHPGNNATAPYTPEGFVLWWERATDLSDIIDGMVTDADFGPRIDQRMIGAAGFSLGGYTVLELAGAQTDISVIMDQCRQNPATAMCHAPEMRGMASPEEMLRGVRKTSGESLARSAESFRDRRIKAVFAMAPGLSMAQTADSLRQIRIPVELVVGASDPLAPAAENADWIRQNVHGAQETVLPGGIAHYTFLDVCTDAGKARLPEFCVDKPGVDRAAVHEQVDAMAVGFFDKALKWR
jgi:predicted dienelactone hydrolase